ncbi:MAG: hypothetical protein ACPLRN_03470 [Microgenomates group bacterium]
MSEKLLKIVFGILFLVLLGEIGYLIYTFNQNQKKISSLPIITQSVNQTQPQTNINSNPAYSNKTIESLSYLKKNIVTSSILENNYQGKIIEIDNQEGYLQKEDFKYVFKIRIENQDDTNSFYFNKDELEKINVYDKNNQKMSIDTLKIGDFVSIKEKLNLLEDPNNNLVSFDIYLK